jgi:hypothetical protein
MKCADDLACFDPVANGYVPFIPTRSRPLTATDGDLVGLMPGVRACYNCRYFAATMRERPSGRIIGECRHSPVVHHRINEYTPDARRFDFYPSIECDNTCPDHAGI